jgi:hypothetical protein
MGEQRPAGDLVQHLGSSRAHAGALAGREHDDKAATLTQWASSEARSTAGAVISEWPAVEKVGMHARALANKATESTLW